MRTGKVSENVLKRSVLRQITDRRAEVVKGAGVGNDSALLSWGCPAIPQSPQVGEWGRMAVSMETVALPVKNAAYLAVIAAANNLAAAGASPTAAFLSLTFPLGAEEALLKEMMGQADSCCQELSIQIAGGHTEVSGAVKSPIVTATVVGQEQNASAGQRGRASLDIVVSKWIGMEGTFLIADEKEAELSQRYPARLISKAKRQGRYLSVAREAAIAYKFGSYAMHDVRCGGIFGALWELAQKMGVGLDIDLKKIPVKQETIEVCEFYGLNPYQLLSGGMLIMAAGNGEGLVRALHEEGISASLIGCTRAGNDRIITAKDEIRYLEPPVPDEILKIFS